MASDPTIASQLTDVSLPIGCLERKPVRIDKFEVVRHIATGGMGTVYKARDLDSGRDVALKILPRDMASKPFMLERFKREARSAAKLNHENIVRLLETGEIQGIYYLVMEFVEGIDLHEHVRKDGVFDPEEARQIILQGAQALSHAHRQGIVHRDIKPSNFLLRWEGGQPRVKLLDFGLARDRDDDEFRVTRAGTTVGTVDYMSPEQARDSGAADIRSDLYSLGATWYHLLSGQAPFPGGGIGERLLRLMQDEVTDLRELNPTISEVNWRIIRRLLAKNPADRFQTPEELIAALVELEHQLKHPTEYNQEETFQEASSRHLWYALATTVLLLLGAVVLLLCTPRRPPSEIESNSSTLLVRSPWMLHLKSPTSPKASVHPLQGGE